MEYEEYILKYPQMANGLACMGRMDGEGCYPGCVVIRAGLLQFDETADRWAGPFEGNYAAFRLEDYTNATSLLPKEKGKLLLPLWTQGLKEAIEKDKRSIYPEGSIHRKSLSSFQERPSLDLPIELKFYGNDDTSYAKFYRNIEEALAELSLFEGNQPLNFYEMINGFNFIFTN